MFDTKLLLAAALLSSVAAGCGAGGAVPANNVSMGNSGCGGNSSNITKLSNVTVGNAINKPSNIIADAETRIKNADNTKSDAPTGGKIGVAECDEYIAKYEACLTAKVPEAQRAALLPQLEIYRKGWKNAARNQQAKNALAGGCKVALTTARQSMSAFSCDW